MFHTVWSLPELPATRNKVDEQVSNYENLMPVFISRSHDAPIHGSQMCCIISQGLSCSCPGLCCLRSCPGVFTDPTQTQLASLFYDQSLSNVYACLSQSTP